MLKNDCFYYFFLYLAAYRTRNHLNIIKEIDHLRKILATDPKIHPIIRCEEKDSISYILAEYIDPLLNTFDNKEILTSEDIKIMEESLNTSDEYDLPEEFQEHPICARCENLSWHVCSCKNISYCSIWCQYIDWINHIPCNIRMLRNKVQIPRFIRIFFDHIPRNIRICRYTDPIPIFIWIHFN